MLGAAPISNAVPRPAPPNWRHRVVARYYRAGEHPARLRCLALLKRLLCISTVQATVAPGVVMELDESDYVQREILFQGGYELRTLRCLDQLLTTARGMLDFGAHMGQFTLRAARALAPRGGKVFAIEPTPGHAAALLHNAALSGLTNIELCTAAISAHPALLRMIAPHSANTGGSRLATSGGFTDLRAIPLLVPVRPAAELVPLIPQGCLDLVKMDVEGHEFHILRSLLADGASRPRDILLEFLPVEFPEYHTFQDLAWLKAQGYALRTVDGTPYKEGEPLPESNLWAHHHGAFEAATR